MKIGILARRTPQPEPQHDRYRAEALRRGHVVVDLDVGAFVRGGVDLFVGAGDVVFGGVVVDVDVVLCGALPGASALTSPPETTLSAQEHAQKTKAQHARHLLARGVVTALEQRGVPVVSPSKSFVFDNKVEQLLALHRAGLPLPKTRVGDGATDEGDVVKAITGGAARVGVAAQAGVPRIVQERVRGDDLRAVVVGGVCVAVGRFDGGEAETDDAGRDVVDVRARGGFVDGSQPWLWDRDPAVADLAVRAAAACCVDVAAVDLKRSPSGLFVLEVNRTPVLADLATDLGVDVSAAVVDLLEKKRIA